MKEALLEFLQTYSEEGNGLRFFEMPTGSGKTYGTIELLHEFLNNPEKFHVKRIIYLTNIKSNLNEAYEKLANRLKDNKELFERNVLKITANLDSVIENILNVTADDEITKSTAFIELKNSVSLYKQLEKSSDCSFENIETYKKDVLTKNEKRFRIELERIISKWNKQNTENKRIERIKKEFPWLISLYPAILTSKSKVLFISTDKFHSGNNPIVTKSYRFISNSIIKNSLIVIDESDKAKMHLLNSQIHNATDYQVDLLQVVCSIHKSFATDDKPEDLFAQNDVSDPNKTTRAAFYKTKEKFEEVFETHNLKYQFKLSGEEDYKNFFIFHDFDPMTISSSKEANFVYIKKDDKKKVNIITKEERKHTDRLGSLIGDLVGVLRYFIVFISIAADNYSKSKNQILPIGEQLEFEDAVSSILSVFGLEQGSLDTLKRIIVNMHKFRGKKEIKSNEKFLGYDLYEEGFQLYSFLNEPSHDLNTKIMMSFLDDTPEKFLKNLASNTCVACISATASADTVLNNFNIRYLKEMLGDTLSDMPDKTKERLKNEYKKNRSEDNNIRAYSIDASGDNLADSFSDSAKEKELFEELIDSFPNETKRKSDPLFEKKRFTKISNGIRKFILNKNSKVLLVLSSRLLKSRGSNSIYNEDSIDKVCEIICETNNIDKPVVLSMTSKNIRAFMNNYKQSIDNGKRVIIFSSYSTAGTGRNLQYSILDEFGEEKEVDIDSIYLEKPTYILSIPQKNMKEAELSHLIYENLALATNQEQEFRTAKTIIRNACRIKEQDENELEIYNNFYKSNNYSSISVNNAVVTIIKQAIGRISRVQKNGFQIKEKNIYLDNEILVSYSFENEKDKFNTLEFDKVVELSTLPSRTDLNNERELIEAINNCDITRSNIRSLLKTDKSRWLEDNFTKYKNVREFLLLHPTISEELLSKYGEMRIFYLKAPKGKKINSYWFKRNNQSDDYRIDGISYEKKYGFIEASSNYVKLDDFMKLDMLREYFINNNYATCFIPNDYILLPNILDDIYRGAIGEIIGRAIFEQKFGIELDDIKDLSKFEKFDYCLKENHDIYIDFKHWSHSKKDDEEQLNYILNKKEKIGAKAVFIVNIMSESDVFKNYSFQKDNDVNVIPWLIVNKIFAGPSFEEKRCKQISNLIKETIKKYENAK